MAKFRINPASLARIKANLAKWEEKKAGQLSQALGAWADEVVGAIGKELTSRQIIDQGILYAATTRSEVERKGQSLKVKVFNPSEYATVVEFGRRPGQGKPPPLLPLVGWAGRKGIISHLPRNISFGGEWEKAWAASGAILRNMKKGGGGKKRKQKPMDPIVLDLLKVRLIAKKIFEKGTHGRRPFANAWDRKAATFARDVGTLVSSLK